ncbi:MAG: hypothetical protein P0Y56_02790 [Candidatus Andeanibacterium colombiense]|uniref:Uncharacterized protein n=1 Tax=Candidatus Andeanibacterium colombiense TaxID=3121345 RepID=A0AAJ6BNL7_9SPHN|nr:MAG: hypothetical protein P0Y56_02790 [Sphingomonadaceae bacterium]
MEMTVPIAQMRITRDLRDAETALDDALLKQSSLLATMVTARRETASDPFTGHEALLRLTKSQQTLVTAAGELARVHGGLRDVQRDITGTDECPPGHGKNGIGDDDLAALAG